ncbi:MAG: Cache 3/Cache 2 fusion domain-containing protein [Spirochaetaceae bacterium]|nr:Cache 3/Cache 2 fusion domain-containing protein [Spirochaetaceae bacterium]
MRKVLILILLPLLSMAIINSSVIIFSVNSYLVDETFNKLLDTARHESADMEDLFSDIESLISVLSISLGSVFSMSSYREAGDSYLKDYRDYISPQIQKAAAIINDCNGLYFMFSPAYGSVPTQVWYNKMNGTDLFERVFEYPDPKDFNPEDPNLEYYYKPLETQKAFWSDTYIDVDTGDALISFTAPVFVESEIIGIAGFDLSLASIKEKLAEITFKNEGYAFLVNSRFDFIYHPRYPMNTPLEEVLGENNKLLLEELTSGNSQNTVVYRFLGEKKRMGYKRLKNDWVLGITAYEKEIFSPVRSIQNILLGISSIILLIAVLISYTAARFITKPIILLTAEVKKSLENLDSSVENPQLLNRKDEIGNLSRKFRELQWDFKKTLDRIIQDNVSLERLAQLGNQVGAFTHEIKTPIGIVLTSLTFSEDVLSQLHSKIESKKLTEREMLTLLSKIKEGISLGIGNIEQAKKIIKSFKNIAIAQSDIKPEQINLNELIDDVSSNFSICNKNNNIQTELKMSPELELESISGYLTQVFNNLFQNSIYHGFHDRQEGKIIIEATINNENVLIKYSDNGVGIPEENAEKIFKPYFTTAQKRGGTGLGMHIIQTIIHNYLHGSIGYDKNHKPGVLFHITLPVKWIIPNQKEI